MILRLIIIIWIICILYRILLYLGLLRLFYRVSYLIVILLVSMTLLWCIFEMIFTINILRGKSKPSWIKKQVIKVIKKIYYEPLTYIGNKITKWHQIQKVLYKLNKGIFGVMSISRISLQIWVIYFTLIPRLILGISLIFDVIVLMKIVTFYKMLWIIIVPITFQAICGLLNILIARNKVTLEESISVDNQDIQPILMAKKDMTVVQFSLIAMEWVSCYNTLDMLRAIELIKYTRSYLLLKLFIIILFIIAWFIYITKVVFWVDSTGPRILYLYFYYYLRSFIIPF